MKYQGSVSDVKAIQKAIQKTKLSYTDKKTGWDAEPGVEPSTLYTIRLVLEDKSQMMTGFNSYLPLHGFLFFISFNYRHRDDYGEVWIKDADMGRLFKVFPQVLPLFGKLQAIILPEKQAQISREKYHISQALRSEA